MQHKRRPKCYCITAESIFKLQIATLQDLPMSPWSPTTLPPHGGLTHVRSGECHGHLEDAVRMLQTAKLNEKKSQLKQQMLATRLASVPSQRYPQKMSEYQFCHLSTPQEHISNYRRSCTTVSTSNETLNVNNRNTSNRDRNIKTSGELSYILFEPTDSDISCPLSRPLFRAAGQATSHLASKLLREYWSTSMSTVDGLMKSTYSINRRKSRGGMDDSKIDEIQGVPLILTPSHQKHDHTICHNNKSTCTLETGTVAVPTNRSSTCTKGSPDNHPIFAVDDQAPAKKCVTTCLFNLPLNAMIVKENNSPCTTNGASTVGKLLSARLRALSDSGTPEHRLDISNTLQSKPLLQTNKSSEAIKKRPIKSLMSSTSSPDFVHVAMISQHVLPPPTDYYYNPQNMSIGKETTSARTSVSARVKHRLSLADTPPTELKKPSAYLKKHRKVMESKHHRHHHQTNCLKRRRHVSSGNWAYFDRNISAPSTLDDVISAE